MNQDFVSRLILSLDTQKRKVGRSQPEKTSNLSSLDNENENTHLFTRQSILTSGQPSAPETRHVVSCGVPVEQNGSPFQFPADYGNSALPPQPVPDAQPTCSTASSSGSNAYFADEAGTTSKQHCPELVSGLVAVGPDGGPNLLPAPSMGLSGHPCWPLWTPVRNHHPHLPCFHPYSASAVACDSAFQPLHPPPPPPPPPPFAAPWRYHPYARHFRALPHAGPAGPANVGVTWPRRLMYGGRSLWHSPSGVWRHPCRASRQQYLVPSHDAEMPPYFPRAGAWALGCHPWGFEAACAVHREDAFEPQMVAPGDHVYGGYGVWDAVATGFGSGAEDVLGGDAAAGFGKDALGGFGNGAFSGGAGCSDKGGVDAPEGRASSALALAEHGQGRECTADGVAQNVPDMYGNNPLKPYSGASQDQLHGEGYGTGAVVAEEREGGVGVQQETRRVDANGDAATATATEVLAADTAPEIAASVVEVAATAAVDAAGIESRPSFIDAEAATMMLQCNTQPLSTSFFVQRPRCFPAQPRICGPVFQGSLKRMAPPPPPYASVAAATGAPETAGAEAAASRPWGYHGEEPPPLRRRRSYSFVPAPPSAVPAMLPALAAAPALHQPPAHRSTHEPSPSTLAPRSPPTPAPLQPPPPAPMLNVHATAPVTTSLSPAATAAAPLRQHVLPYRMLPYRQHPYCCFSSAQAAAPAAAVVNFQGPAAVPEPETDPDVVTSVDKECVPLGPMGFGAPVGLTADDNRFFYPWPPRQALPYGPVRSSVPPSAEWSLQPAPPYTYVPYRPVPAVAGPSSASPTFMSEHCFVPRIGMEMWPMVVVPQA